MQITFFGGQGPAIRVVRNCVWNELVWFRADIYVYARWILMPLDRRGRSGTTRRFEKPMTVRCAVYVLYIHGYRKSRNEIGATAIFVFCCAT